MQIEFIHRSATAELQTDYVFDLSFLRAPLLGRRDIRFLYGPSWAVLQHVHMACALIYFVHFIILNNY